MVVLRPIQNLIRQALRVVHIVQRQAAGFARGLNRDIAHAEDPLRHALIDADILNFVELNGSRGFRREAELIAKTFGGNGGFLRLRLIHRASGHSKISGGTIITQRGAWSCHSTR